jgi:rod shape-determining protein MreC
LHDKTIRRRRAVLALLVVISLALLTDYFGQSSSSPLHSIQQGIATVLSPVQSGASTVLSPFRDAAKYVSQTFNDRSQLAHYKALDHRLTTELGQAQTAAERNRKAASILKVDNDFNLSQYDPKSADVIGEDPSLWYQTIKVNIGSSSGVKLRDPVIGPGGLVGDVTNVGPGTSEVSLITSPDFSVGATIQNQDGASGLIQPLAGDPTTLTLIDLPGTANVQSSQLVVTSGFSGGTKAPTIESWAPPGIPIGTVSTANPQNSVLENQEVQVTPLADLQYLSLVSILTLPHNS